MAEQGVPDGVLHETRAERQMQGFKHVFIFGALGFLFNAFWLSDPYRTSGPPLTELWGSALAYVIPLAATAYAIHTRKFMLWRAMPLVWIAGLILLVISHWAWLLHSTRWPSHVLTYSVSVAVAYWWWRRRRGYFVR